MNDIYFIDILPEAQQSIEDQGAYIEGQGSPLAAAYYVSGLYSYIERTLSHNPEKFRKHDHIEEGLRLAYYKTTIIAYIVDNIQKIVTVTNIFHMREDYIRRF